MTQLHHLALGAVDVARVAHFYRDAFGLEVEREHHTADGSLRSIWLKIGSFRLMVERTEDPPRQVEGVGAGLFLMAFSVSESEQPEVEARLLQLGAPIESRTNYTAYARDPEGNRIAISHFPKNT